MECLTPACAARWITMEGCISLKKISILDLSAIFIFLKYSFSFSNIFKRFNLSEGS